MTIAKISVIVTTYNWPEALRSVLKALSVQTCQDFEIVIADDGSREKTHQLIEHMRSRLPVPLHHVYQPDEGFRASAIRNKAIMKASAATIVFIDGDCIPPPRFIEQHLALREPGYFVAGNRVLLTEDFTLKVLAEDLRIEHWSVWRWLLNRVRGHCNRILPFLSLPLGILRTLRPKRWQGAMGCHLAVWRQDLFTVNGWDEQYEGWGYEDSDLVIRLIQANLKRKEARFAVPVIHLWHPIRSRADAAKNWARLEQQFKQRTHKMAIKGLNQYIAAAEPNSAATKSTTSIHETAF